MVNTRFQAINQPAQASSVLLPVLSQLQWPQAKRCDVDRWPESAVPSSLVRREPLNSKLANSAHHTENANTNLTCLDKTVKRSPNKIANVTLGEYIHRVVKKQFTHMMRYEKDVLRDYDPEPLHQMRVNARRLRSTMERFDAVLVMPAAHRLKNLRRFSRTLGVLRNLDVVINRLQVDYYPLLPTTEQTRLDQILKRLHQQRKQAFKSVKQAIKQQSFSQVYEQWLVQPAYAEIADQPATCTLSHLLMPQVSEFLLHPGWSIASTDYNPRTQPHLHDLRKVCKHLRYQLEGIKSSESQQWLSNLKDLQYCLGTLQDLAVLRQMLLDNRPKKQRSKKQLKMPELTHIFQQQQVVALNDWEELRQPYSNMQYQYECYHHVLRVLCS